MAQSGYTPILIYASSTPGALPSAANLTSSASGAELAINYADGKLYFKNSSGVVTLLAGSSSGPAGGSNTQVQYNSSGVLAGSSNMTFDGTSLSLKASPNLIFESGGNERGRIVTGTGAFELMAGSTVTPTISLASSVATFTNNPVLSGGTANGVLYLNGSNVATSGSALTFDGTRLEVLQSGVSSGGSVIRVYNTSDGIGAGQLQIAKFGSSASYGPYTANTVGINAASTSLLLGTETNNPVIFYQNNTEQMRLTSTGLGIGTSSPSAPLVVNKTGWAYSGNAYLTGVFTDGSGNKGVAVGYDNTSQTGIIYPFTTSAASSLSFWTYPGSGSITERMRLDSSGNLGLGVTPSAWGAASKAIQFGAFGSISGSSGNFAGIATNRYNDGANKYIGTGLAALYEQGNGVHYWYTAPSGTAGNPISFGDPKMTLDASGNLGVGATSPAATLHIRGGGGSINSVLDSNTSADTRLELRNSGTRSGYIYWDSSENRFFADSGRFTSFYTGGTECARITSTGSLLVGTTTQPTGFNNRIITSVISASPANPSILTYTNGSGTSYHGIGTSNSQLDIVALGTNNSIVFLNGADGTTPTERARIDSSGNLGVGASSPNGRVESRTATVVPGDSAYAKKAFVANIPLSTSNVISSLVAAFDNTIHGADIGYSYDGTGYYLAFATNSTVSGSPTERARITRGGDLLVGTTSNSASSGEGIKFRPGQGAGISEVSSFSTNANDSLDMYSTGSGSYRFYVDWGGTVHAVSTSIAAISDQRLKENIRDLDAGLDAIMALKPRKFDWKEGKGKDIKNDRGFIAQEFEEVFPDLIDTWKDPAPEGEEPYKSVRQDLIPVLVKAIQEQQALITSLTARVALLEGN